MKIREEWKEGMGGKIRLKGREAGGDGLDSVAIEILHTQLLY